jgi:hypothetical protein
MQWIQLGCGAIGAALLVLACNSADEPMPAGNDHGVPSAEGNAAGPVSSGKSPPATELGSRDLDPVLRREIGLDLEADLDPNLRREVGLDPDVDLDPQLRRELGLDPAPDLSPVLRREVGLDPW